MRARLLQLTVSALLALAAPAACLAAPASAALPPVRHVFVLVLENETFAAAFGSNSPAPYLARMLPAQGALLTHYYAIGHQSLDNYVAMVSGQAPNYATQSDCPDYVDFKPDAPGLDRDGQALGSGCVYPAFVPSLPDQLEAAHLGWKGYMEDMGNDPQREPATCGHGPLGRRDRTHAAEPGDQYTTKHDPFVYFHRIIDDAARCDAHVVNLERLLADLQHPGTTPNYAFIVPNLCNDGHDLDCVDGRRGGLAAIDAFLAKWVPLITRSPAFRADGLLIVTFDESSGIGTDSDACCGERGLPGARFPPGIGGPGGGRIGAVVLSPFVKPGTVSAVPYNHYSLLKTVERIFGLEPLGFAAPAELAVFGPDVFTAAPARRSGR
jgi:phosphatidylinositol-3-phosphatase